MLGGLIPLPQPSLIEANITYSYSTITLLFFFVHVYLEATVPLLVAETFARVYIEPPIFQSHTVRGEPQQTPTVTDDEYCYR